MIQLMKTACLAIIPAVFICSLGFGEALLSSPWDALQGKLLAEGALTPRQDGLAARRTLVRTEGEPWLAHTEERAELWGYQESGKEGWDPVMIVMFRRVYTPAEHDDVHIDEIELRAKLDGSLLSFTRHDILKDWLGKLKSLDHPPFSESEAKRSQAWLSDRLLGR